MMTSPLPMVQGDDCTACPHARMLRERQGHHPPQDVQPMPGHRSSMTLDVYRHVRLEWEKQAAA